MDYLRRKLTVRAQGQSLVLIKRPVESAEHVLQKALLWALYLPRYPGLRVEVHLPQPSRYKPDLLALGAKDDPSFWGECGVVALDKLRFLLNRYRHTHFAFSKWDMHLDPFTEMIEAALPTGRRTAPVELISFPPDASDWIGADGSIVLGDFELRRWE